MYIGGMGPISVMYKDFLKTEQAGGDSHTGCSVTFHSLRIPHKEPEQLGREADSHGYHA